RAGARRPRGRRGEAPRARAGRRAVTDGDPGAGWGSGMQSVGALAVAWGWPTLGTGEKAVWAALDLPGHADAAPGSARASAAAQEPAASPAAARDMRAGGRAADPDRRDPSPAAP